jgi:hypothetical protein
MIHEERANEKRKGKLNYKGQVVVKKNKETRRKTQVQNKAYGSATL